MKKIIYSLVSLFVLTSCDKYLDITPKGQVIPTSIEDYDMLLNGGTRTMHTFANERVLALTADDFNLLVTSGVVDISSPDNQDFQLYSWGQYRFYNQSVPVSAWNRAYDNIYRFNKVINEVMDASPALGFSDSDKPIIQAEALYGRALDYFFLVNIFAPAYSSSASTDPAVPIVTQADVTQTGLQRATVEQVYNFIIDDLEKSLAYLPSTSKTVARPNLGSGYALLSRVYLYKGDYSNALEYANRALNFKNNLEDYRQATFADIRSFYEKEQYSYRYFDAQNGFFSSLSDDLVSVLGTDDARYNKFFMLYPGYGNVKVVFSPPNATCSVGEMFVTRAECYARTGEKDLAIADLNTLREKRLDNYVALTNADFATDTDLLKFCFDERRRETLQSYIRLFDLKRMNLDPALAKTVIHEFQGETYTATPDSGKLVLPIPAQVLRFNPSW